MVRWDRPETQGSRPSYPLSSGGSGRYGVVVGMAYEHKNIPHAHVSKLPTLGLVRSAYECVKDGLVYEIVGPCPRCYEVISGTCEPEFDRRWMRRRAKQGVAAPTRMWCGCGHQHLWAEGVPSEEPGCGNEFELQLCYPPVNEDGNLQVIE